MPTTWTQWNISNGRDEGWQSGHCPRPPYLRANYLFTEAAAEIGISARGCRRQARDTYQPATLRPQQRVNQLKEQNYSHNQISQHRKVSFRTLLDIIPRSRRKRPAQPLPLGAAVGLGERGNRHEAAEERQRAEGLDTAEYKLYLDWREQVLRTLTQAQLIMQDLHDMNVIITEQSLSARFAVLYEEFRYHTASHCHPAPGTGTVPGRVQQDSGELRLQAE